MALLVFRTECMALLGVRGMPVRQRQRQRPTEGRQYVAHRLIHLRRHIECHRSTGKQVFPTCSNNGNKESRQEVGLPRIRRHLLVLLEHEVGRRRENQVVPVAREIHGFRGTELDTHRGRRRYLVDHLNHAPIRALQIQIRIESDVGNTETRSGQGTSSPSRGKVQNPYTCTQRAICPFRRQGAELINGSVVQLKCVIHMAQEIIGGLVGSEGFLFVSHHEFAEMPTGSLAPHGVREREVAFRFRLQTMTEEEVVKGFETCAPHCGVAAAIGAHKILVRIQGFLAANRPHTTCELHM